MTVNTVSTSFACNLDILIFQKTQYIKVDVSPSLGDGFPHNTKQHNNMRTTESCLARVGIYDDTPEF